jgi:hypothetical protein
LGSKRESCYLSLVTRDREALERFFANLDERGPVTLEAQLNQLRVESRLAHAAYQRAANILRAAGLETVHDAHFKRAAREYLDYSIIREGSPVLKT